MKNLQKKYIAYETFAEKQYEINNYSYCTRGHAHTHTKKKSEEGNSVSLESKQWNKKNSI